MHARSLQAFTCKLRLRDSRGVPAAVGGWVGGGGCRGYSLSLALSLSIRRIGWFSVRTWSLDSVIPSYWSLCDWSAWVVACLWRQECVMCLPCRLIVSCLQSNQACCLWCLPVGLGSLDSDWSSSHVDGTPPPPQPIPTPERLPRLRLLLGAVPVAAAAAAPPLVVDR